jgi:transglutaminase-like putative cysteine protease
VTAASVPADGVTYQVRHLTRYDYEGQVTLCHNLALLLPRPAAGQDVLSSHLVIEPGPGDQRSHTDHFGNVVTYFSIDVPHDRLAVTAESEVRVLALPPPPVAGPSWEESVVPPGAHAGESALLRELALPSPLVPSLAAVAEYAAPSFPPGRDGVEAVLDLMHRIHADLSFDPGFTTVSTALSEVIEHRRGVCQDFAHLAVGCLRSVGLAARYVSGYLETDPPPGQPKLVGADASHAWCSVWLAGTGWVDLDPTNGARPFDRHITAAWGRDYGDVTPLKGVVFAGGAHQRLTVEVDVRRVA